MTKIPPFSHHSTLLSLKITSFFALLMIATLSAFAQKEVQWLDSARKYRNLSPQAAIPMVRKALNQHPGGKLIAEGNFLLGVLYNDVSKYDSALFFLARSLPAYESLRDSTGIANCYDNIGSAQEYQTRYQEALQNYEKGYAIRKKLNLRTEMSSSLNNIGNIHVYLNNYSKALELFVESLKLSESLNDKKAIANCYNNIGNVYDYTSDYDKALEYYDRARAAYEELHQISGLAGALNNIGLVYKNKHHPEKAVPYYKKALEYFTALKSEYGVAVLLNNLAVAYELMENEKLAMEYHQRALEINKKIGNSDGVGNSYAGIGNSHLKQKQFGQANEYFLKALEVARENNSNDRIAEAYAGLAMSYEGAGDYKRSLALLKQMNAIRDTVLSAEKSKKLYEIEQKYESALKEKQIALLNSETQRQQLEIDQQSVLIKQRNLQLLLILLTVVLTGAVLYLAYSRFRLQQARGLEVVKFEKEQAIVRSIYEQRMSISKDMHDEIGSGLTHISLISELLSTQAHTEKELRTEVQGISNASRKLIQSMSEIIWAMNPQNETLENLIVYLREQINAYLEPFDIEYKINLPDNVPDIKLSNLQRRNIFLVTKESVNNSLKHAIATWIEISMTISNRVISISVKDNGKGFDKNKIRQSSNGLRNMRSRMEEVNGSFEAVTDGGGTQILYSMPIG